MVPDAGAVAVLFGARVVLGQSAARAACLEDCSVSGARWWIRTTDPRRVKAVLYR